VPEQTVRLAACQPPQGRPHSGPAQPDGGRGGQRHRRPGNSV